MNPRALILALLFCLSLPIAARADTVALPRFSLAIFEAPDDTPAIDISPDNPFAFTIPGDAPSSGTFYFRNNFSKIFSDFHVRFSTFFDADFFSPPGPEGPLPAPPGRVYVFPSGKCYNENVCSVEACTDASCIYHGVNRQKIFGVTYASVPGTEYVRAIEIVFTPSVAPEPSTWAILIVGLGAVGSMIRRSRAMAT